MIRSLAIILTFQLVGEITSRGLGLPLPGPVVGLIAMVAAFILRPDLAQAIRPTATGLLAHLSLFFVPAGVGIVAQRVGSWASRVAPGVLRHGVEVPR